MSSKKKKYIYLCPYCNSSDLSKGKRYGQCCGICNNPFCRTWWPIKMRVRHPFGEVLPTVKKPRKVEALKKLLLAAGISIGLISILAAILVT